MDGDGVSDVSAGAGKRVGGMVNGTGLTSRSIARSGACGSGDSANSTMVRTRAVSDRLRTSNFRS